MRQSTNLQLPPEPRTDSHPKNESTQLLRVAAGSALGRTSTSRARQSITIRPITTNTLNTQAGRHLEQQKPKRRDVAETYRNRQKGRKP